MNNNIKSAIIGGLAAAFVVAAAFAPRLASHPSTVNVHNTSTESELVVEETTSTTTEETTTTTEAPTTTTTLPTTTTTVHPTTTTTEIGTALVIEAPTTTTTTNPCSPGTADITAGSRATATGWDTMLYVKNIPSGGRFEVQNVKIEVTTASGTRMATMLFATMPGNSDTQFVVEQSTEEILLVNLISADQLHCI